jgi:DNA-binding CsgD family transcriptional regulator
MKKLQIPAGILPADNNIEFVGNHDDQTVYWFRNGNVHYFADLPKEVVDALWDKYQSDAPAKKILSQITDDTTSQLELYTYYMYGDLDNTPDFANGELSDSENFITDEKCISLSFANKRVTIGENQLSARDIAILRGIVQEYTDDVIASDILGVAVSTFNYHKKRLFDKIGVQSKSGLVAKALQHRIIIE